MNDVGQLGCVLQDIEPPESVEISRKGTKVVGTMRRVRFTRAALRQANIRDKGQFGKIQVKSSHQRSPYAVKFEDGSREEDRETRGMRPWRTRGDLPRISISPMKQKKLHSIRFPMSGSCRPHPQ